MFGDFRFNISFFRTLVLLRRSRPLLNARASRPLDLRLKRVGFSFWVPPTFPGPDMTFIATLHPSGLILHFCFVHDLENFLPSWIHALHTGLIAGRVIA